jgi:hypothetical protein
MALYLGRKPHLSISLGLMILIGLIEDIAFVRPLGLTSFVLVTLTVGTWMFESLYRSKLLWWWFGFGLIGEALIHLISRQSFQWWGEVGQLIALLFVFWITQHRRDEGIYVGQ